MTTRRRWVITVALVGVAAAGLWASGAVTGRWGEGWSTSRFVALMACLAAGNVIMVTEWSYARITRRANYSMLGAAVAIAAVDNTFGESGVAGAAEVAVVAGLVTGAYLVAGWRGGVGGGDVICVAWVSLLVGSVAGPFMVLWVIGLANLLGIAAIGVARIKGRHKEAGRGSWRSRSVAFGPWLCGACAIVLLVAN